MSKRSAPDYAGIRLLAAIVEGMPDRKFDLKDISNRERLDGPKDMHECGTTACALGVACIHPAFAKKKLRFIAERGLLGPGTTINSYYEDTAAEAFNITPAEAYTLFRPNFNHELPDKQEFKQRVIRFLRSRGQRVSPEYLKGSGIE